MKKKSLHSQVELSSGNVFLDLGLDEPELLLTKSKLIAQLHAAIQRNGLTKVGAAKQLKISTAALNAMLRGDLDRYAVDQLQGFVSTLGMIDGEKKEADANPKYSRNGSPK